MCWAGIYIFLISNTKNKINIGTGQRKQNVLYIFILSLLPYIYCSLYQSLCVILIKAQSRSVRFLDLSISVLEKPSLLL